MGKGDVNARIMVVGEAPGANEDVVGRPFVGRSGSLLNQLLSGAGIDPSDVYITNAVKCRPPDNSKPEKKQLKACRKYLDRELQVVRPTHVLLLGATALSVVGKTRITELRGTPIVLDGITYFPVFHPAYVLRDPGKEPILRRDIEKFSALVRGESIVGSDSEWEELNADNFDEFLETYIEADRFSFDLETTSLKWWLPEERINLLILGLPQKSWVIPFDLGYWYNRPHEEKSLVAGDHQWHLDFMRLVCSLSSKKRSYAQNGKFDNSWLIRKYGLRFRLDHDTGLAHHLLDENSPHDLKFMVKTLLDGPDYDIPLKHKTGLSPDWWARLKEYGGRDGGFTLQLGERFDRELDELPLLRRLFDNLTMPAARAFEDIEQGGMYVNLAKKAALASSLRKRLVKLEAELNGQAGSTINWNSPAQVGEVFFDRLGMPVTHLTAKGKPSTSESAIVELKDRFPIANLLSEYREVGKQLSTYVDGWDDFMVGPEIYFSYKLHGTVTGRYASRLHSIPRDDSVRSMIEAPEDWELVAADYSQIELRIVAEISGDPEMLRIFQTGGDIHLMTASQALGIPPEEVTKEQRKMAKAINFGFIYGMGWRKFVIYSWEKYGVRITDAQAKKFRKRFFELFNGLPKWHQRQRRIVNAMGFVRTKTGRVRHLPQINARDEAVRAEAERLAINSPVQGFGAELKSMSIIELHDSIPHDKLLVKGEHHDAILMWKRRTASNVLPDVKRIMENPRLLKTFEIDLRVPLVVEIEVGPWGKGEKWNEV